MMLVFSLFLWLVMAAPSLAAPTFDQQCSNGANAATTISCSITVGSLSNGVMYIAALNDQESGDTITTPTVGGSSTGVTLVDSQVFAFGTSYHLKIFRLLNPPSGAQTVAFGSGSANLSIGVVTYSGVNQTTPDRTPSKTPVGSSTTPSITVTTTTGDVVAEFFWFAGNNSNRVLTFDGSQTSRINRNASSMGVGVSEEVSSGASVVASGTFDFSGNWMIIGVPLIEAVSSGGAKNLLLMGVGQ